MFYFFKLKKCKFLMQNFFLKKIKNFKIKKKNKEKIAKEHPELNLNVPNSAGAGGAKLGTQSETSASFKGKSSFSW